MSRMKYYVIGLSIAIVIYAPIVSWLTIRDIIVPPDLIDSVILFILASATIFYAVRTSDIAGATEKQAKATKEQADASVRMAEEMREQRHSESLPLLVPDMTPTNAKWPQKFPPNEVAFECIKTGVTVAWHNSGKGIAINARFSYWAPPHESHPGKVPYVEASESKVLEIEKEIVVELESGHQWREEDYYRSGISH